MAGGGLTLIPTYTSDNVFPPYQDRLLIKSLTTPGVIGLTDYKVSAGTGLQVNVQAGNAIVEETKAIEEGGNTFYNGLYEVPNPIEQNPYNNVEVSAVNNQIAQIILRVYDVEQLKIAGSSFGRIEWLNGTPSASATEAKMKEGKYEGAAALPQSSFRLARVLVPKNATKSSEYYIEDTRRFSSRPSLQFNFVAGSYLAKVGENTIAATEGSTVTLPLIVGQGSNGVIGVNAAANNIKVAATTGQFVEGEFSIGTSSVTLNKGQHIIVQEFEGGWLIIAGSPAKGSKSIVSTEQSRTNVAYGTLTTPDEITLVVPENGLIAVAFQATWKSSASHAGRAAIFIGANQLKAVMPNTFGLTTKPVLQSAYGPGAGIWSPLASFPGGLVASESTGYEGDVTTGQVVGVVPVTQEAGSAGYFESEGGFLNPIVSGAAGPVYIFVAAGTYKITVQYKSASGSVTVKDRKLWAWLVI